MSDKEILEKTIQKAIDGGYNQIPYSVTEHADFLIESKALPLIIYRHDFAKALWGDKLKYFDAINYEDVSTGKIKYITWKYHLQQMVISPDPIQYLKDNLRD